MLHSYCYNIQGLCVDMTDIITNSALPFTCAVLFNMEITGTLVLRTKKGTCCVLLSFQTSLSDLRILLKLKTWVVVWNL